MKHVVSFSGGVGSWAAAKRVVERYGTADVVLLFADTLMEDEDTYRFLDESASNVGVPLTRISDGRTPWEVFHDVRYLGNSRIDPCSKILKRELLAKWFIDNCNPATDVMYLGIDWSEIHRLHNTRAACPDRRWEAPMCEPQYLSKEQMLRWAESEGLQRQRLYEMGFPHANCGGFCVKAGIGHFLNLLKYMPERYAFHENKEQEIRAMLGKDVSILRDRSGGKVRPMTLKELREREQAKDCNLDRDEWGGCGCALAEISE